MKKIQERHQIMTINPNGIVGEKIKVSLKLSEYFAEMDLYGMTDDERKDIKIALLECLNKIVKIYDKDYKFSG
ncbi:MAG: hypothetical protein PHS54_06345 [Clostridia bacterium]|nr:hypothetical protein [Clostridia bacterium]